MGGAVSTRMKNELTEESASSIHRRAVKSVQTTSPSQDPGILLEAPAPETRNLLSKPSALMTAKQLHSLEKSEALLS